jgi:hypothetical protein
MSRFFRSRILRIVIYAITLALLVILEVSRVEFIYRGY